MTSIYNMPVLQDRFFKSDAYHSSAALPLQHRSRLSRAFLPLAMVMTCYQSDGKAFHAII